MQEVDISTPALWLHCQEESEIQIPITRVTKTTTLGRHPDCGVHIPSQYVSRVHAEVYFENTRWWIKDRESSNGVYIDNEKTQCAPLTNKCLLQLGKQMSFKVFIDQL